MKKIKQVFALLLALVLTAGILPVAAANTGFHDVPEGAYYADAVIWASEEGITLGTGNGAFSPESTVTRAEAVTFLWRAAGSPAPAGVSTFSDVTDKNAYYYKPVLWALEKGITNGVGGGRFDPYGTLAYDEILAFLCRFAGEDALGSNWSASALSWAKETGLTDGLSFSAKAGCPRRDVVYCLFQQLGDNGKTEEQPVLSDEAGATLTITTGFLDRKAAIDISPFNLEASQAEQLARKIADLDGKNPYGIKSIHAFEQDGNLAKHLSVTYTSSTASSATVAESDWRYVSAAAQAEAQRVVGNLITSNMSDYDVVKTLHDYLITHCDYDIRVDIGNMPFISHQAEGALLKGTAVCSGYAKAYEILLDAAGIPCETITGFAGGYHAWNLVQVDGQWYHVDATWDDPTTRGGDYIRYEYFLKSDKVMVNRRHRNWEVLHSCTSTKYDEDLLDSVDQATADERQKQVNAILALCAPALEKVPTWTQAELQALSDQQLDEELYFIIDLSDSGWDSNTLSKYSREVINTIVAQHPQFAYGSFRSSEKHLEFYRSDIAAEKKRRQDIKEEEKDQQEAQDAVNAPEVQKLLEQAIASGTCETYQITLTGYTDGAIQLACKNMKTPGYTFSGYTYAASSTTSDYNVTAKTGGIVAITNYKWGRNETQRYIDQIEEAIRNGRQRIELQPGNYPDKDESYYASKAVRQVAVEGYTVDSLVSKVDYVLYAPKINANTRVTTARIEYPAQGNMTEEEALAYYTQQIRDAIQRGETQLKLATHFKTENNYRDVLETACAQVKEETGYIVNVSGLSRVAADSEYVMEESTVSITPPSGN